ncbi:MAG: chromophore lyase CpcT/CpeT [Bacteroidota bacterium]
MYVEQAIDKMQEDPYRQRVYKLTQLGFNSFLSEVYSIPNDDRFIWSWKELAKGKDNPIFIDLHPLDLTLREGCGVYLQLNEEGNFQGRTRNKTCTSTREDTEYVQSDVTVSSTFIRSLDQGFDTKDEKVWGADEAYQFDRYLPDLND